MFSQIAKWFTPDSLHQQAAAIYIRLVERARNPFFYTKLNVPDSLDGRFEMILLHLVLILERLKVENDEYVELRRVLGEIFIQDMDQSLREIGISDTGVRKRMKAMIEAFYGRLDSYQIALESSDALGQALRKNVYGTLENISDSHVDRLVKHVENEKQHLASLACEAMIDGEWEFGTLAA